jgi:hypothetical protein
METGIVVFLCMFAALLVWLMWAIAQKCGGDDEQD